MSEKYQRFDAIRDIIGNETIYNQDDLLERLRVSGIQVTQATLSRDLKALKIVKTTTEGGKSAYSLTEEFAISPQGETQRAYVLVDGFKSIDFSGNLCVIKTEPGFASPIAALVDNNDINEIIGTIAGDDTIMLIMKEGVGRSDLVQALISVMPRLSERLI